MNLFNTIKKTVGWGIFIIGLLYVGYLVRLPIYAFAGLFYITFGQIVIFLLLASVVVGVWYWWRTKQIKRIIPLPGFTWLILLLPGLFVLVFFLLSMIFDDEYEWIAIGKVRFLDRITYKDIYMHEWIYVKNMPKNTLRRGKTIIAYFDSAGVSRDDFITKMLDIKEYEMEFERPTKYSYAETGINPFCGCVRMSRCMDDHAKCRITTQVSISNDGLRLSEITVLLDECDPSWYEVNKNNTLVKYYMELKK